MRGLMVGLWLLLPLMVAANPATSDGEAIDTRIEQLAAPLYSPFVERYVLDELRALRSEVQSQQADYRERIAQLETRTSERLSDRQLRLSDTVVGYASNTITYFFYVIAGISSVLIILGWTSLRDFKERMQNLAEREVGRLITEYEQRLGRVEEQLSAKTRQIQRNQENLAITNEIHALWLRASQESSAQAKIAVYDRILKLRPESPEALSYKADAALELGEPQWAISLCLQALQLDADNGHAHYQLACAHAALGQTSEALAYLGRAIDLADSYRLDAASDESLLTLRELPAFVELVTPHLEEPA
ncbi:MAG: hypothetical protein II007_10205 [Gammaproteobacteria bacterium]|nr:hypothetical protein [Gammaproteobacteria bacterium]